MKFTLVFQGRLPASGNKSKTKDVAEIRAKLSPQMETLWNTHKALEEMRGAAHVRDPADPLNFIPLFGALQVGESTYTPLVRSSLHLACDLNILFLRQEDPGSLISQGGDIDGRIKTLLDALRMPSADEDRAAGVVGMNQHVVMENDALVTSLKVDTERLLFPQTTHQHEVHLVIEVGIRVLRVVEQNTCLL